MIMNTQVLMHNEVGADELHYEPTRHTSISADVTCMVCACLHHPTNIGKFCKSGFP